MTETEAAKLVAILVSTYPSPGWVTATMEIYSEMILDLDEAETTAVIRDWIKSHDERPTIAAIRREVAKAHVPVFMPPDEAWGFVVKCFGTVGHYHDFPDTHPLVKRAVDSIGWKNLCLSEDMDMIRAHFRMAYTTLLERSLRETATSDGAAALPEVIRPFLNGGKKQLS